MRKPCFMSAALLLVALALAPAARAGEFSGQVSAEGRAFFSDSAYPGQDHDSVSVSLHAEYYHGWGKGSSLTLTPFARYDSADDERTHFDLRELSYQKVADAWELKAGVSKVFWGVTEFVHLVDIINQDDGVESPDGEEKLGQPMVRLSVPRPWGTLDAFVLPYFRERTFPGEGGRLRTSIPVKADRAIYESPEEERHVDLALRYSHSIGDVDLGIYHFRGTGREPTLQLDLSGAAPELMPYYEQISQSGLDVLMVAGQWILKLEGIRRTGQGEGFYAATGGFEYTFSGFGGSSGDLGLIMEYARDSRGRKSSSLFNNDIMAGLRLALNDQAGSELLAGYMKDLYNGSGGVSVEASSRVAERVKAALEARSFIDVHEDDPAYDLRDDDYLLLEIIYYF